MNDELKETIGRAMHIAYEQAAIECGWSTQDSCKVNFEDLPAKNRFCMDASVEAAAEVISDYLKQRAAEWGKSETQQDEKFCLEQEAERLRP